MAGPEVIETETLRSPRDWNVAEVVTWIKTLQGGAFATSLVFESIGFFEKQFPTAHVPRVLRLTTSCEVCRPL